MTVRNDELNIYMYGSVVHLLGDDAAAIAYVKVVQSIDKYVEIS